MKTPKLLVVTLVVILCFAISGASNAYAKSPQRHRWEGVAIGIGAAILGSALLHAPYHPRPAPPPFYHSPPFYPEPGCRHWKVRRIWVPPQYERIWIPGHYGRRGCWIPGHWEKRLLTPGHWEKRRFCTRDVWER